MSRELNKRLIRIFGFKVTVLTILTVLAFSCYPNNGYLKQVSTSESMQNMDNVYLEKMKELAFWFIETGLGQYYERRAKTLIS